MFDLRLQHRPLWMFCHLIYYVTTPCENTKYLCQIKALLTNIKHTYESMVKSHRMGFNTGCCSLKRHYFKRGSHSKELLYKTHNAILYLKLFHNQGCKHLVTFPRLPGFPKIPFLDFLLILFWFRESSNWNLWKTWESYPIFGNLLMTSSSKTIYFINVRVGYHLNCWCSAFQCHLDQSTFPQICS